MMHDFISHYLKCCSHCEDKYNSLGSPSADAAQPVPSLPKYRVLEAFLSQFYGFDAEKDKASSQDDRPVKPEQFKIDMVTRKIVYKRVSRPAEHAGPNDAPVAGSSGSEKLAVPTSPKTIRYHAIIILCGHLIQNKKIWLFQRFKTNANIYRA